MDFNPTQALDLFIPKNQTLLQAIKADYRRWKRITYYTSQYRKRFPTWKFAKCVRAAEKLVDSLYIVETWNKENPNFQI